MTRATALRIALICVVVALIGWTGSSDIETERASQSRYCQMVGAGHWPDYDPAIDCSWRSAR